MQILVEAQDTTVVQIEDHATQVQTNMQQGVVHVEKALDSAKAARRVSWLYVGKILDTSWVHTNSYFLFRKNGIVSLLRSFS